MARLPVGEDQNKKSQGSFAQDSSKNSHVTPESPVYYDKSICSEMGEQGESNLGMEIENTSAKDGEGKGLPVEDKEENGNPEREEETAEEVVSQLKSSQRRKMEDGGAEVAGSTKGEEDSAKSVEEKGKDDEEKEDGVVQEIKVTEMEMAAEGRHEDVSREEKKKKASPKRKRRRRPRRQAEPQRRAVTNSGVCYWNINMEALLKMIKFLLLFVYAICMPITDCKPVMDETMQMCAVYNDPICPALTAIYWINGTDDIQLWKKDMPTCKDLEPCVPCRDGGRVIVLLDEVCHKIDMEGCHRQVSYEVTVCPRFGNAQHIQVRNPDSLSSHTTTTPPPDKNTTRPSQYSWVVGIVGVLVILGVLCGAIYARRKRRHLNSGTTENGGTDEKDDDDGKASSKPFLQDNLGQRMS